MAGHSKRHNIKHKKARADAIKGKMYAKMAKLITVAAREGGDISMNPSLAMQVAKAKRAGVPNHVIDKAVAKGSGSAEGEAFHQVYYEAYGPGGCAMYIRCLTDNINRSAANVRTILTRAGCEMAKPGAVGRQFQERGVIIIDGLSHKIIRKGNEVEEVTPFDAEQLELTAMEYPILDIDFGEGLCMITTTKEDFLTVTQQVEDAGYHITEAELKRLGDNPVQLTDADADKLEKLTDSLDDDDDVDSVYTNVG